MLAMLNLTEGQMASGGWVPSLTWPQALSSSSWGNNRCLYLTMGDRLSGSGIPHQGNQIAQPRASLSVSLPTTINSLRVLPGSPRSTMSETTPMQVNQTRIVQRAHALREATLGPTQWTVLTAGATSSTASRGRLVRSTKMGTWASSRGPASPSRNPSSIMACPRFTIIRWSLPHAPAKSWATLKFPPATSSEVGETPPYLTVLPLQKLWNPWTCSFTAETFLR